MTQTGSAQLNKLNLAGYELAPKIKEEKEKKKEKKVYRTRSPTGQETRKLFGLGSQD